MKIIRAIVNVYLAIIMFLLGLVMATSGFILWLAFESGNGGDGGRRRGEGGLGNDTFWGVSKHTWIDIHDWVAVTLLVFVVIHIYLHRKWIIRMLKYTFRKSSPKQ